MSETSDKPIAKGGPHGGRPMTLREIVEAESPAPGEAGPRCERHQQGYSCEYEQPEDPEHPLTALAEIRAYSFAEDGSRHAVCPAEIDYWYEAARMTRALAEGVPSDEAVEAARFSDVNHARCVSPDGFGHALESWSVAEWTNAVAGEAGEACNLAKKLLRHRDGVKGNKKAEDQDTASLRRRLAEELADVVIYTDLTMRAVGYDLATTVREVFNRKSHELGAPYFVASEAIDRPSAPPRCECCERPARYCGETHPYTSPVAALLPQLRAAIDDLEKAVNSLGMTPERRIEKWKGARARVDALLHQIEGKG